MFGVSSPPPAKGCSGGPSSKSRFCKWGGPGRSRGSVGAPWAETRGTKLLCCTRDLLARRDPPGAFLPRPGTCAGRYLPAGRCHGPDMVPAFPHSPGGALPSASFAGCMPPHGGPPPPAWMALPPQPPLPARQVTRQEWLLLWTPMLGTPGTLALGSARVLHPPLASGPGDAPTSVVPGRIVQHKVLSPSEETTRTRGTGDRPGALHGRRDRAGPPNPSLPLSFLLRDPAAHTPGPGDRGTPPHRGRAATARHCCTPGLSTEGQHREAVSFLKPVGFIFRISLYLSVEEAARLVII